YKCEFGAFFATSQKNIYELSLLEQRTGNFNSLVPRENSVFFWCLDSRERRPNPATSATCVRRLRHELGPKSQNSLLAGNFNEESGSPQTASTTKSLQELSGLQLPSTSS